MVSRIRALVDGAAILAFGVALFAPAVSRAADMPFAPPVGVLEEERVTFGTGWYLRGDVGITRDAQLPIGGLTLPTNKNFFNSWSVGVGGGYKFNEWFRSDVTADWRNPRTFEGNTAGPLACQSGSAPIKDGTGAVVGSFPVYGNCYDYAKTRLTSFTLLFNGYLDLGNWGGFTPYVGAGAGVNLAYQKFQRNWFFGNSTPYAPSWTDPFTGGTYSAYWDQTRSTKSMQFAWALMAGVAYAFTPHVTVDLGYRYLNLGRVTNYTAFTGPQKQTLTAQEFRLGLRYTPD